MGNKSKGSTFERGIAVKISEWWTSGKRSDIYWRSQTSGARATIRHKKNKETFGQAGDIQAVDPIGQPLMDVFTIELKKGYSEQSFFNMMEMKPTSAQQMWEKFYLQVTGDMKKAKAVSWLLIWQRDRKEPMIYTSPKIMNLLKEAGANLRFPYLKGKFALKSGKIISVFVCKLDDFLKQVKPKHIKKVLKNERDQKSRWA